MKNETNTRDSQGGIPRICVIALSICLFASLHAEAVTPQLNGNGSPGVSVSFSSPAGGGFSSSGDYMHVNAIAVYAVPKNGDPSWSSLQKVVIDWYLYFFDPQKGWTRWG